MNSPKQHHFVPYMLLKRFADCNGKIHVFNKLHPESGVYSTNPRKAFRKSDLNTINRSDGSKDTRLEHWYSDLEGKTEPIISKIEDAMLSRELPNLNSSQREIWDKFYYHFQTRAPDIFERRGLIKELEEDILSDIQDFEKNPSLLSEDNISELRTPEALDQITQNASVLARASTSLEILKMLSQRGLVFGVVEDNSKSFIIGDHPILQVGDSNYIREPWLPISTNIAVSPYGPPENEALMYLSRNQVRKINEFIFRSSNIAAGRSKDLICSLARL